MFPFHYKVICQKETGMFLDFVINTKNLWFTLYPE